MEMEDSTEIANNNKQIAKSAFYLPICESLLQYLVAILRFLRFKLSTPYPHDPSSATTAAADGKASYAAGSVPPPAAADPATSQTSRAIRSGRGSRSSRSSRRVPGPGRSRGGGGQINKDTSDSTI